MPNFDGKGPRGNRTVGKGMGKCKRPEVTEESSPRSEGAPGRCGTGRGRCCSDNKNQGIGRNRNNGCGGRGLGRRCK